VRRWAIPLAALAAAAALVGTYIALGGTSYEARAAGDPCQGQRWHQPHGTDDLVNQLVLSTLDGAACRLQVSRAELALGISSPSARRRFLADHHLAQGSIDDAVHAGLDRAVNDAVDAGVINGLEGFLLSQVVQRIPADRLLDVAERLADLLG
jgi:hypothetical protein